MHFNGRGFYNTLLFSSTQTKKNWQTEDYSQFSKEKLFEMLKPLKISLSESVFLDYSKNAESPEDLTDILCADSEGTQDYEKSYLLIFELWKRLNPQKESLSIFCDKLDHLIHDYDEGKAVADDLVKTLWDLSKIFEDSNASGLSQKETYEQFSSYLAQDLETFLYDFLSDLIEAGEKTLAFELIFAFYDFLHDKPALDVLKSTINLIENPEDSEAVFFNIMEKVLDKKRYNLVLDAIYFTYDAGFISISKTLANKVLLETSHEQKQELLSLLEPLRQGLKL